MNDLMNCKRYFDVDSMKLYISTLDQTMKLKFSINFMLICNIKTKYFNIVTLELFCTV